MSASVEPTPVSPAAGARRRRGRAPASAVFLLGLALAVAFGPPLCRWFGLDGESIDLLRRLEPPGTGAPLGTDELGRDLLVRLLEGGRVSLAVGLLGALLAAAIGTALGLLAGFARGAIDALIMRATDIVLALPLLPLLVVLAAVDPGKLGVPAELVASAAFDVTRIVLLVALFGWPTTARLVRAGTLSLEAAEFVRAARALGASPLRIALRHVLPGLAGPITVATTLAIGQVVLGESVLSFLGLGIRPPTPSWGNMLTHAQELLWHAPLLALWPGLAILLTVTACNLLGDALAEAADPRARRP
ncbi:MAG: ABC transporter permease [Geminicoccaceae bacterium]|nr:ABC transporter permease [Geminicoccaceae bacterium]MCX8102611.1 ABC transporter permease [Geminicoccaceae bacterium]MDW8369012.1 ABC transporter permease [Geminicoccaceae bacterium]